MNNPFQSPNTRIQGSGALTSASEFMRQVFITMTLGLVITGAAAWGVSQSPMLMNFFFTGIMRWVTIFAPFALVLFLSARIHAMSFSQASITFGVYSALTGISLSAIFLIYTGASITKVFFITAGLFGSMALIGYTTKMDLSRLGSYLMMAVIGIVIASVVNMFMGSSMLDFIISIVGVIVFSGLTAYDTQKLIAIAAEADIEAESTQKIALMGALNLYLDFLNMFLFLLRLFGGSRD